MYEGKLRGTSDWVSLRHPTYRSEFVSNLGLGCGLSPCFETGRVFPVTGWSFGSCRDVGSTGIRLTGLSVIYTIRRLHGPSQVNVCDILNCKNERTCLFLIFIIDSCILQRLLTIVGIYPSVLFSV